MLLNGSQLEYFKMVGSTQTCIFGDQENSILELLAVEFMLSCRHAWRIERDPSLATPKLIEKTIGPITAIDAPFIGDANTGKEPGFKTVIEPQIQGLPQGSSLSPLLSSFVLAKINEMGIASGPSPEFIFYADDGLIYSDWSYSKLEKYILTFLVPKYAQWGIKFNLEKSGWVKQDGQWETPLKFLGLTYDATGSTAVLKASTRKGATLVFDKGEALIEYCNQQIFNKRESEFSLSNILYYEDQISLNQARLSNKVYQKAVKWLERTNFGCDNKLAAISSLSAYLFGLDSSLLSGNDCLKLQNRLMQKIGPTELKAKDICQKLNFSWESIIQSQIFGFLMAKLYSDSWNQRFKQNFALTFKSDSWTDFATQTFRDPLGSLLLTSAASGLDLRDIDKIDVNNLDYRKVYGFLDKDEKFHQVPFNIYYFSLTSERRDMLMLLATLGYINSDYSYIFDEAYLQIRWIGRFKDYPPEAIDLVNFTVFNASSYANFSLVNIFSHQKQLDLWREAFGELGLSTRSVRRLISYLRYGLSASALHLFFSKNPHLIKFVNRQETKFLPCNFLKDGTLERINVIQAFGKEQPKEIFSMKSFPGLSYPLADVKIL